MMHFHTVWRHNVPWWMMPTAPWSISLPIVTEIFSQIVAAFHFGVLDSRAVPSQTIEGLHHKNEVGTGEDAPMWRHHNQLLAWRTTTCKLNMRVNNKTTYFITLIHRYFHNLLFLLSQARKSSQKGWKSQKATNLKSQAQYPQKQVFLNP